MVQPGFHHILAQVHCTQNLSSLPDEFLNPPCFTVAGNQQKPLKVKKLFLTFKLIADAKPPQNRLKTFGPIHQLIEHDTIQLSPQVGWDWE